MDHNIGRGAEFAADHGAHELHRLVDEVSFLPVRIGVGGDGGSEARAWQPGEPVPLVLFEAPCVFRKAGIEALDAAGIPWRIAFTSPGLAGLWAAVDAGLGISPRTTAHVPQWLHVLGRGDKLPKLPPIDLALYDRAARSRRQSHGSSRY